MDEMVEILHEQSTIWRGSWEQLKDTYGLDDGFQLHRWCLARGYWYRTESFARDISGSIYTPTPFDSGY